MKTQVKWLTQKKQGECKIRKKYGEKEAVGGVMNYVKYNLVINTTLRDGRVVSFLYSL